MSDLVELLGASLPQDHSRQQSAQQLVQHVMRGQAIGRLLDVGCGAGNSVDFFRKLQADVHWVGVDIESSPEVSRRQRADAEFHTFDGRQLPFESASFDLLYSKQVLEHVRHPAELMKEMLRVLKPGGWLVGSTSHLEPFHSYSYWNYTPHGFKVLVEEAGFELTEIRPSIDVITLVLRRLLGEPKYFSRWFGKDSPLNTLLSYRARRRQQGHARTNAAKLVYCAQFVFVCRRP